MHVKQLFETILERKQKRAGVAKSVPKHLIGAFPITMPRNIFFFACDPKNRAREAIFWNCHKTQAKTRWCRKIGAQPSMGIPHHNIVGFYVLTLIVCKQKHILFSINLLLMFIQ